MRNSNSFRIRISSRSYRDLSRTLILRFSRQLDPCVSPGQSACSSPLTRPAPSLSLSLGSDGPYTVVPHEPHYRGSDLWVLLYSKAIVMWTSDSMYTAVVICASPQSLAFARSGDETWTLVKMGTSFFFEDVIFYEYLEEGRFYTAAAGVNGPPFSVNLSSNRDMQEPPHAWKRKYLIEISGNLFEVLRVDDISIEKNDWRPTSFRVYTIDRDADKWVAVKNLGNYALFLGDNHFIAISKHDFPALKENSIYFTDDFWEGILVYKDKTRVFSLEDGSVEPSFYPKGTHQARPQPSWFVPNLSHNV